MPPRPGDRREEYVRATERLLDKITTCTQMTLPYGINIEFEWQYLVEIYDLAAELMELQSKAGGGFGPKKTNTKSKVPLPDRLIKFKKWLVSNGVPKNIPIEFVPNLSEGIGAVATRDIKTNEEVIRIPRALCMTTNSAANSPLLRNTLINVRGLSPFTTMVLHLLAEKTNPTSFWKPYIDILPETYPLPIYFTPDDMIDIKGTTIIREVANSLRELLRAYATVFRTVEKTKVISVWNFTFTEFRWAAATLFTRQNLIPGYCQSDLTSDSTRNGDISQFPQRILALIPGWDMINHKEGLPITSTNNYDDGDQVFTSPEAVNVGDQVYMGYTEERSNRARFIRTGFLAPRVVDGDNLQFSFKFPNFKDVAKRKELAYKLFQLTEPFPLDVSLPLEKDYDNILGTLTCAFGTKKDIELLDTLEAAPQGDNVPRDQIIKVVEKNILAITKAYEENKLECKSKMLQYIESQALLYKMRHDEKVMAMEQKLNLLRDQLINSNEIDSSREEGVRTQFQINAIEYFMIEQSYADKIIEYVRLEKQKLNH